MPDWVIGQKVAKVACPKECQCDGRQIPPGTSGVIGEISNRPRLYEPGRFELCLKVLWATKPAPITWWVYEHGLEPPFTVPEMFYLDL